MCYFQSPFELFLGASRIESVSHLKKLSFFLFSYVYVTIKSVPFPGEEGSAPTHLKSSSKELYLAGVSCPSNAGQRPGMQVSKRSRKENPRESGRIPHLRFPYAIAAAGVFDGHAGDQAAAHLVAAVPSVFAQALQAAARGVPPPSDPVARSPSPPPTGTTDLTPAALKAQSRYSMAARSWRSFPQLDLWGFQAELLE